MLFKNLITGARKLLAYKMRLVAVWPHLLLHFLAAQEQE